ncbi:aldo/keto reductase, partial [Bdellovibrionota bacterium]
MEKFATKQGTEQYCKRFSNLPESHFNQFQDLKLSSIGFGSYLGNPDNSTDVQYHDSVKLAVSLGCNVIDSAINYRFQRSERSIGKALLELENEGFKREELFISTKGGFLSFDKKSDVHPRQWFKKNFVDKQIANEEDLLASCHCIAPAYLREEIKQSLQNLNIKGVDLYYIHNPEIQLEEIDRKEFERRMKGAFAALEQAVSDGLIRFYGTATWNGYRI